MLIVYKKTRNDLWQENEAGLNEKLHTTHIHRNEVSGEWCDSHRAFLLTYSQ